MSEIDFHAGGRMYHVRGQLHTKMEFKSLKLDAEGKLRLNFRDLTLVTSHGVKVLRDFIFSLPDQSCEMHECPRIFVEMLNMVPTLTCTPGHRVKVVSVLLPGRCDACTKDLDVLIDVASVTKKRDNTFDVPVHKCPTCQGPLAIAGDPDDVFLFLTY